MSRDEIDMHAPVAQLDRALDSDSKGRWFESSRAYQMNESRFSNYFIEKWDLSYPRSLAIWSFPLFHVKAPILQNAPNAKLIFLCMAAI